MQTTQLHDDNFFKVLWDENACIIGIDWKEATSAMTDEQFKAEPTLFARYVLSPLGKSLVPVISVMHKWGVKHLVRDSVLRKLGLLPASGTASVAQ